MGDKVEAQGSDGRWYGATIAGLGGDKKYTVEWDDKARKEAGTGKAESSLRWPNASTTIVRR